MKQFKNLALLLGFITITGASMPAFSQTAVVDVDRILIEYSKSKTAAEEFKVKEEGLQKTLIEAQDKVKAAKTEIEKKNLQSTYDKKLKEQAAKIKAEEFKKLQEIESDIFAAIDKVNKTKKYDTILKKSATVYATTDITDEVLKNLNK